MTLRLFLFLEILLLFIILIIVFKTTQKQQLELFSNYDVYFKENLHKTYQYSKKTKNTIFVSVASYRDTECMKTIVDLFEKAENPNNIYVGICQQNKNSNENCIPDNFKYNDNIRIKKYDYKDALGPTFARYICSHLWDGEEFYLQIDSHSRCIPKWDKKLLDMYKQCPSEKAILTHRPPTHQLYDKVVNDTLSPTYTCSAHFENNFHIIADSRHVTNKFTKQPFRSPYVSAGLLFGKSEFLHDVPFDPYLPYLFQGEEILLSVRFWTNGWDCFNLPKSVITHYYNREKENQPHFWDDHQDHKSWHKVQMKSNKRYYYILEQLSKTDVDPLFLTHVSDYGVGNKRSLKSWFEFTGIDIKNKTVKSRCSQKYNETIKQWEDK